MNKKLLIISALILPMVFIYKGINSSPTGAPEARTGSPGDGGGTCFTSGCHNGAPTETADIITTNIPSEGYTPNTAYTITVTLTGTGRKGFQVSPQNTTGTGLGTLASGTGSMVTGGKYITHTAPINTATAVWTFQWTAPAKGTGDVNFYGAFAITRNTTKTQVLKVTEKLGSSIQESDLFSVNVFPNPVSNQLNLLFNNNTKNAVIDLLDLNGKEILHKELNNNTAENAIDVSTVNEGNYIVKIKTGDHIYYKKISINH